MTKITSENRNGLPTSAFAGPDRSYPVDTKARAVNAKGRAKQQENRGALSEHAYDAIVSKANRKIAKERG